MNQGTPTSTAAPHVKPDAPLGARIAAEARRWIGTPFHLHAKVRGGGCDCLGLLEGVWEAVTGGALPPLEPFYSADWRRLQQHTERFRARLALFSEPLPPGAAPAIGDIVIFGLDEARWLHGGIASGEGRFIHALSDGAGLVGEGRLDAPPWAGRSSGLLQFINLRV